MNGRLEARRIEGSRLRVRLGVALALALTASCSSHSDPRVAAALTGGDPARGAAALSGRGCGTCHTVPGVNGATGTVGPSLQGIASRTYLHGNELNAPDAMIRWIRHPQSVERGNAMPDLGLSEEEARDIAAYLYTLR